MRTLRNALWPATLLVTGLGLLTSAAGQREAAATPEAAKKTARAACANLPLAFEANRGQTADPVRYLARGPGYTVFLTADEAVLSLRGAEGSRQGSGFRVQGSGSGASGGSIASGSSSSSIPTPNTQHPTPNTLRMRVVGAEPAAVTGVEKLPGVSHYLSGRDPAKWRTNVPHYAKVRYDEVYPGIDLVYYGNQRQLEYDFLVSPGADPARIRLSFSGARRAELDDRGDLLLHTPDGYVRHHKPVVYQEIDGKRRFVEAAYVLAADSSQQSAVSRQQTQPAAVTSQSAIRNPQSAIGTPTRVSFRIPEYDRTKPLVIDPVIGYSTYLGGTAEDDGRDIAIDDAGNAYVTGATVSSDFPVTEQGWDGTLNDAIGDAYVTKLNAAGTAVIYSTYLGGVGDDAGNGIAVDVLGNAYVAGVTTSSNFPLTASAFQDFRVGSADAFLTKLNAAGSALLYSTYLGGGLYDEADGVDLGPNFTAVIAGHTDSANFPVQNAAQGTYGGSTDGFVARFLSTASGPSSLEYSTFIGGSAIDRAEAVAVDRFGSAYVTGSTTSANFPTVSGSLDTSHNGGEDAFVVRLGEGGAPAYSTFLGGAAEDVGSGIAVDRFGTAYVTGWTESMNFPTRAGSFDTTHNGLADAFLARLNERGTAVVFSTFLGGSGADEALDVGVGFFNAPYVTGRTASANFPTARAADATYNGAIDAFVTRFSPSGSTVLSSTFLGGADQDEGHGIAIHPQGAVYVTGFTASTDYPTTAGAFQRTLGEPIDAFVTRIVPLAAPAGLTATPVAPGRIRLAWQDTSPDEQAFVLERRVGTGAYRAIRVLDPNTTSFLDVNLADGTTYTYRIRALNSEGFSDYSNEATATTPTGTVPAAPSNLTASAPYSTRVRLAWQDNSSNETGFVIERKTGAPGDPGTYRAFRTVPANTRSFLDVNLTPGTTYTYRVRAQNQAGFSAYSNEASVTTPQ